MPDEKPASVRYRDEVYIRCAKATAETALRDPYAIGGRGSELAKTILALLEEADRDR